MDNNRVFIQFTVTEFTWRLMHCKYFYFFVKKQANPMSKASHLFVQFAIFLLWSAALIWLLSQVSHLYCYPSYFEGSLSQPMFLGRLWSRLHKWLGQVPGLGLCHHGQPFVTTTTIRKSVPPFLPCVPRVGSSFSIRCENALQTRSKQTSWQRNWLSPIGWTPETKIIR